MKLYTSMAGKVVGMLREEITLEEFKKDYQKTMVTFPVPDPEQQISAETLDKMAKKSQKIVTVSHNLFVFSALFGPGILASGMGIGYSLGGLMGLILGGVGGAVCPTLTYVVGARLAKLGNHLNSKIAILNPERLPAVTQSIDTLDSKIIENAATPAIAQSEGSVPSLVASAEAADLLRNVQSLILTVSSNPHGTEAGYEVKRIIDDTNSLLSISGELSKYDSEAAEERLMKGLRLLERDAEALVDHEKTLITQRLDSHNSYMETRSLGA